MITEPFKTYPEIKRLAGGYFETLRKRGEEGGTVAWGPASIPAELLRAMDIDYVLGEPYGALCAASGLAEELLPVTEDYGFTTRFCAYSRNFIGSYLTGKSPLGKLPEASFMIGFRVGCNDHAAWFETLAGMAGKPYFPFDLPQCYEPPAQRHIVYVQSQLDHLIRFMEQVSGKKMEEGRLVEAVRNAHELKVLWTQILDCCKAVPAPLNFRSQTSFMIAAVWLKGTREAVDAYSALLSEVKDRVRRGVGSVPEEKARLLWDNVPMWFYPRVFNYLEEKGLIPIVCPYMLGWGDRDLKYSQYPEESKELLKWQEPSTREEALRESAKTYIRSHVSLNNCLSSKLNHYEGLAQDFRIDGAIFHSNRGCKSLSLGRLEVAEHLRERFALPVLVFESSMADPEGFNESELLGKLDTFTRSFER